MSYRKFPSILGPYRKLKRIYGFMNPHRFGFTSQNFPWEKLKPFPLFSLENEENQASLKKEFSHPQVNYPPFSQESAPVHGRKVLKVPSNPNSAILIPTHFFPHKLRIFFPLVPQLGWVCSSRSKARSGDRIINSL